MKQNITYRTAVKILRSTVGIESDRKELLPQLPLDVRVRSLLSNFHSVEEIPYSGNLDGYITVRESQGNCFYQSNNNNFVFQGPLVNAAKNASDLRFTIWGSQGFLYRFALSLLEKKHGIYNLHACALYDEIKNILYVVIGSAGSGKTVYLLNGLGKGLKLFSTETVHFRIENGNVEWFLGSLVDNIRIGTLLYDFPSFLPEIERPDPDRVWLEKIAVNLSSFQTDYSELRNPDSIQILFPRIEQGRKGFILNPITDKRKAAKALFDNISQKITETVILFDKIPVQGFDNAEMSMRRLKSVDQLVRHESIVQISSVLSNPTDCWGDLLT